MPYELALDLTPPVPHGCERELVRWFYSLTEQDKATGLGLLRNKAPGSVVGDWLDDTGGERWWRVLYIRVARKKA